MFHAGEQEGNYAPDILYASRLLAETEWTTATIVYTHTTALGSWYPMLGVGHDDVLHLVWENRGDVGSQIMYASGVMGENHVTWSAPITLSSGITTAILPSIASDSGGGLHVIWGEETGRRTMFVIDGTMPSVNYGNRPSGSMTFRF